MQCSIYFFILHLLLQFSSYRIVLLVLRFILDEHIEEASVAAVLDDASMAEDLYVRAVAADEREADIGMDVSAVCRDLCPDTRRSPARS